MKTSEGPSRESELFDRSGFREYMEHAPQAFAVMRGAVKTLVYANTAFRRMTAVAGEALEGTPMSEMFAGRDATELLTLLDCAMTQGIPVRDHFVQSLNTEAVTWKCTAWPVMDASGHSDHLVIELRDESPLEHSLAMQRDVTERMLLGALREGEAADNAEASSWRAALLASASRELTGTLDEPVLIETLARIALPHLGEWCIIDTIEAEASVRRLAIFHPDPSRQALARELERRWTPEPGDLFGGPAILRGAAPTIGAEYIEAALRDTESGRENAWALTVLGIGPLLTVPLVARTKLLGAITFVGKKGARDYTQAEVELAQDLAARGAMAIEAAQLYREALSLKVKAEMANQANTAFLGRVSHDLRAPLNGIRGYVDLIDDGIRGPVTDAQHKDLDRIRKNQQHLLRLITEILNFVRLGSDGMPYHITGVAVQDAVDSAVALIEPLIQEKRLAFEGAKCGPDLIFLADPLQVRQILLNLLSNAIKFTPAGGYVGIVCEASSQSVAVRVVDSGIGIPVDKQAAVFEPFVQVENNLTVSEPGFGLGLAISRDLARAMQGDLEVESDLGQGSRFTLTLPRAFKSASGSYPAIR
ncbi:MAG: PAS domain-containing protein [Anaerolineae bacterium]|nr:PAS domain-containing protein [Gemmatimonadaceae bacterium]